jgi:hypothetical protein
VYRFCIPGRELDVLVLIPIFADDLEFRFVLGLVEEWLDPAVVLRFVLEGE